MQTPCKKAPGHDQATVEPGLHSPGPGTYRKKKHPGSALD